MAQVINGTLIRTILNPYATQANQRPPYMAIIKLDQPIPPAGYVPPPQQVVGATSFNFSETAVPTEGVVVAREISLAELNVLTPGCTIPWTAGTPVSVILPVA